MAFAAGRWLERQPARVVAALGLAAVAAVGAADFATGDALFLGLFYLGPVLAVTWFAGWRAGLLMALASAAVEAGGDVLDGLGAGGGGVRLVHGWNAAVLLAVLALTARLLDALRRALERERGRARHDGLTGLANGAELFERARAEVSRARRYARPLTVAFIDCDHFKELNDSRGHAEGDRALRLIGESLRASVRQTDLAARVGGDELAILFPELGAEEARDAVAKVQARLTAAMRAAGYPVTFSIGVVSGRPAPQDEAEDILRRADALMYEVKRGGRNGARFSMLDEPPPSRSGAVIPLRRRKAPSPPDAAGRGSAS